MKPIIAITAGDTNGVGYEVLIKALLTGYMFEIMRPVIYGNAVVAKQHLQTLDRDETGQHRWHLHYLHHHQREVLAVHKEQDILAA